MLPSTTTAMVSQSPSLRTMPSAPRAQLIGAMFAPAQIHICCGPVESLSASGMGSMLWTSTLSSAPAAVAMLAPLLFSARYCAADGDAVKTGSRALRAVVRYRQPMARNMTDYAATCRSFQLPTAARFNWAFDTFDAWARDPAKLALLWVAADGQPRRFTYAELAQRSRRFANALAGLGVAAGERVLVMLPRVHQWWEIVLGRIRARAVSVPGTTLLTPKDIEYRLNIAE